MADKSDSDAMLALIDQVVGHVHRRRAFLVVTPVRSPPPAAPRRGAAETLHALWHRLNASAPAAVPMLCCLGA